MDMILRNHKIAEPIIKKERFESERIPAMLQVRRRSKITPQIEKQRKRWWFYHTNEKTFEESAKEKFAFKPTFYLDIKKERTQLL